MVTRGQNSANDDAVGGDGDSTTGVSKHSARTRKLPAKFRDALTDSGSVQASKIRRNTVITDDEDKALPVKKKFKARPLVEREPDTDTDQVSLNEGPNQKNASIFSQTSEDTQDICANTDVSSNWDNNGDDEKEGVSGEEEWEYSELDKMATKDAKVSSMNYPRLPRLTIEYRLSQNAGSTQALGEASKLQTL